MIIVLAGSSTVGGKRIGQVVRRRSHVRPKREANISWIGLTEWVRSCVYRASGLLNWERRPGRSGC